MKCLVVYLILCLGASGFANVELVNPKALTWGADASGGAPYSFNPRSSPDQVIGFEKDIVDAIANRLQLKIEHVQTDWDALIPGIERGMYDLASGGLEVTPEHKEVVDFSVPYYITGVQLMVLQDSPIKSLKDCHGLAVGTMKESLAADILRDEKKIDVRGYDSEINALSDLNLGRIQAVFIDFPAAVYYGAGFPGIKNVGDLVGRIEYAFAIQKNKPQFLAAVDLRLREMIQTGELRLILDRWKLWTPAMAEYLRDPSESTTAPAAFDEFVEQSQEVSGWRIRLNRYIKYIPMFAKASVITMELSILSMALAIIWGLVLAVSYVFGPKPISWMSKIYIEVVRGTPLLIQLFFIFYGLPNLGIKLDPMVAGVLALGLNYAAAEAENYRAGLGAVARGQMEAALALGLNRRQTLREVVVPQAVKFVIPSMTNDFIALLKDSSLVSIITLIEVTKVYNQLALTYYDYFGFGIMAAIFYLVLGFPFVLLARWLERRLEKDSRRKATIAAFM